MSNFIALTRIDGQFNDSPVLVNLDNVTHLFSQERSLRFRYITAERRNVTLDPPEVRAVTIICFTAGLHEEPDSIYVAESLDTIYRSA